MKEDPTTAGLAPVGRETVQDRVYGEMRRALIGGFFEPGQVLTIRQLADALMTSTMPVREALGRLISEQALEALPNRQIRVPPMTLYRLSDLLRANGLSGKIKLAGGSTLLVPAGTGANNLESMGAEPRLPQIIEPEPKAQVAATPAARSSKADKPARGNVADSKLAAKDAKKGSAKLAASAPPKGSSKVAKATGGEKTKVTAAKPATPAQTTKVAKSGNGRRS